MTQDNITANNIKSVHTLVLTWYQHRGRHHLPWRNTSDPYAIYLSETMLQQTQVATVERDYYPRFLKRFPTIQHIANAQPEDVLQQWQGLGYYRRAKHLHEAARACAPTLPANVTSLMALKGIGRNTAHAIMAFAHREPYAIMEANVKRIITRIYALTHPNDAQLWRYAEALLDHTHPFEWNQAMMDIGAMICTPKTPQCALCPLESICQGKASPHAYPEPKPRKRTPMRNQHIIIAHDCKTQRILMLPRSTDFLHGLYGFIETDSTDTHVHYAGHSQTINTLHPLGCIRQVYSHFTLLADVWLWDIPPEIAPSINAWYSYAQARALPSSRADDKALELFLQSAHAPL
jgi:A/G-specific adenine glycosylase